MVDTMNEETTMIRKDWNDPLHPTVLVWNGRVHRNGPDNRRGALVGMLHGVEVNGRSIGRGVIYQIAMLTGEVRTVWWDGTIGNDGLHGEGPSYPYLFDVDTDEQVLRNPKGVAWFVKLADIGPEHLAWRVQARA